MELQQIQHKIYEIRGHKVMLDYDLAVLYEVQTKNLNLAVKRNNKRFPPDFMFRLTNEEFEILRFQIATSKQRGGTRYLPYAFTEQGLAMLSGILNSDKAITVNIAIMRAFVFIRQYALSHQDLTHKLKELEQKYDKQFSDVYEALNFLIQNANPEPGLSEKQPDQSAKRKQIGYR